MTNGKCACKWDGSKVVSMCGAHMEKHREMIKPLIEDKAKLEYIQSYAKRDHPLLSSRPCPLCDWQGVIDEETGFWKGKHRKFCSFHEAINWLYGLNVEQKDES